MNCLPSPTTRAPKPGLTRQQCQTFTQNLRAWYRVHARVLPWRGVRDPYRTWISEIMLQQTRVNAVIDHYARFLERFPTVVALALAPEEEVLALWSGLGYYRRARMLHRTAKLVVEEHGGTLPSNAVELRRLPGIGAYTSAAIASIAFGEPVAVVDGNVERVLLRVTGRPETPGAAAAAFINITAQALVPQTNAGDHNQAMMELGATVCLPRGPLCDRCPVYDECITRGEHVTAPRAAMRSKRVRYALTTRKAAGGVAVQVLLQRRPAKASLMAGMLELPELQTTEEAPGSFVLTDEPVLRVRHAIVGTNYYVEVIGIPQRRATTKMAQRKDSMDWVLTNDLPNQPITGLTRKVLQRLRLMKSSAGVGSQDVPLLIGRGGKVLVGDDA
ncbi:A/G-specific adenine glycosylase [Terriglobus roseus]|uniref:Adenine DNA glycosylase n=1 Tax=Terriglobus roseus TaxID=392734 RepID=A0A1H4NQD1_9BACT|nr:A/G-specific adenine glycosylase [Terriglobus roseus]SEB97456.1 A/G-specific DNA-adenine glycosylase [Terriglobus roseus]